MSAPAYDPASRTRLRVATAVWFAVLMGCLLATDEIARLDPGAIAMIVVVATTVMFTAMQVIAREMASARAVAPRAESFMHRPVSGLAVRNLAVVASIYAVLWAIGALPF
jgi:beta-lactamase regulating signal transducer with metallopeptidase domain